MALDRLTEVADGDYTEAIVAVGDLGRCLAAHDEGSVHEILSAIAAVRETLEYEGQVSHVPLESLQGGKGAAFVGGALWAISDLADSFLAHRDASAQLEVKHSARAAARDAIRAHLEDIASATPTELRYGMAARGMEVSPDVVSKALHDLRSEGVVEEAPHEGTDRRRRYYRLVKDDRVAAASNLDPRPLSPATTDQGTPPSPGGGATSAPVPGSTPPTSPGQPELTLRR